MSATYSVSHYNEYQQTKNKNLFEEIVDQMMLDGINPILHEKIKNLPLEDKRMAILAFLDKDRNLFMKIKSLISRENPSKMDYIKDVIRMLREYVKVGEVEKKKFGEVMTSLDLVKEMIATLPEEVWSNPNLKWLDPANGTGPFPIMVIYKLMNGLEKWQPDSNLRYKHIVENMIYTCELQAKNVFLWLCAVDPHDEYETNTYWGSFLEDGFDKHMKEVWGLEKFDVVLGNPPYQSYTHMKFINKSINLLIDKGFLCILHPSQQFLDIKPKTISREEKLLIENVQKYETTILLINGNLSFNVEMFFTPLSITYLKKSPRNKDGFTVIDKNRNIEYIYPSINEVNLLGWSKEYQSLKNKILSCVAKNGHVNLLSKRNGKYYVGMSEIRGHSCKINMFKSDFYTILPLNKVVSTEKVSKHFNAGFETLEEAENFESYLRTKFARFCLSLYKINSTLAGTSSVINAIPILDFHNKYDDKLIRELFKINENEWNFINSIILDFYPEDFKK